MLLDLLKDKQQHVLHLLDVMMLSTDAFDGIFIWRFICIIVVFGAERGNSSRDHGSKVDFDGKMGKNWNCMIFLVVVH